MLTCGNLEIWWAKYVFFEIAFEWIYKYRYKRLFTDLLR